MAADAGEVVKHGLPVNVTQLRELQDGSEFPVDFQKGNIFEGQAAVGDDTLELVAQVLGLFTHLI